MNVVISRVFLGRIKNIEVTRDVVFILKFAYNCHKCFIAKVVLRNNGSVIKHVCAQQITRLYV